MSVEAPERIWVDHDPWTNAKRWFSIKGMGGVEYVRADKLEELVAALAHANHMQRLTQDARNKAEAALAEKDKELTAMREAIKGLLKYGCPVSFCMNDCATDNPGCPTRKAEALVARNAGGKDV